MSSYNPNSLKSVKLLKLDCKETSDTEDIIAQIHLWIFEHGWKHGMKNVTKRVLSELHIVDSFKKSIRNWRVDRLDEPPPVDDDILFLFLTDKLKTVINEIKFDANGNSKIDLDFDLLNLVIDMIETIYRRTELMAFNTFARFIARLKLLELICRIALKESTSIVMDRLKHLFPPWDGNYEKELSKIIRIPDKEALKKISDAHKKVRNNILQLLISEDKRNEYLCTSFQSDINDIVQNVSKHLSSFPKYAEGKLSPTAIEQIIDGIYEDTNLDKEPAVRILLDHLSPQMTAKDLLTILDKLSPETKVIRMNSCFAEFSDSENEEVRSKEMVNPEEAETIQLNNSQPLFNFEDHDEELFLSRSNSPRRRKTTPKKSMENSILTKNTNRNNKPDVSISGGESDSVLLPVKRRLYNESFNGETSTSTSNSIKKVNRRSSDRTKQKHVDETRITRSKKAGPAPKSVKIKRKKSRISQKEKSCSSSKEQGVKVMKADVELCAQRFAPGSPYKRKKLVVSLHLEGRLLNPDGSTTNFFA